MTIEVTPAERNWAALAHLTALLTIIVGWQTGGAGVVFMLLVPLAIYVYFRDRSTYVAFHALQATVFQALGGIAFVALVAAGTVLLAGVWLVTALLSLVLVGLLLVPVSITLTLGVALGALALGVAVPLYPLRGAYGAYRGRPFAYPQVGRLVARTMRIDPLTLMPDNL
jgi:uncharacterized Tic20 family protein